MKKLPLVFFLLMAALIISCASRSQQAEVPSRALTGTIYVIGNDPFTRVALATSDSSMIVLQCSKEDDMVLRKNQGKTAQVTYDGETTTQNGREIHVTNVEIKNK